MFRGRTTVIIISVLVALLFLTGIAYFYNRNRVVHQAGPNLPPLTEDDLAPEEWAKHYPRQYDSYREAAEGPAVRTKYGGNDPYSKLDRFPELKTLYQGYGFAEEYNEDRGHPYAVQDIKIINPARLGAGAACFTCKSPQVPQLLKKYGEDFYTMGFEELKPEINHSIACADCHDPATNNLRITRPALVNALDKMGIDIETASRQEMRTLVCAQCHVEYYFTREGNVVTFPWGDSIEGLKPEAVYEYYESGEYEEEPFVDWVHPASGSPMLKAQHPDYEFFVNSTHHAAGVSCADCHMPYVMEGNVKITSHNWQSPLKTISTSCQVCHRHSEEYLKERVEHIQDNNYNLLNIAIERNVQVIQEIEQALNTEGVDEALIAEAQELHRQSQWLWDWMASENSMGFHNPAEGLNYIGKSIDLAHQAIAKARQAMGVQE